MCFEEQFYNGAIWIKKGLLLGVVLLHINIFPELTNSTCLNDENYDQSGSPARYPILTCRVRLLRDIAHTTSLMKRNVWPIAEVEFRTKQLMSASKKKKKFYHISNQIQYEKWVAFNISRPWLLTKPLSELIVGPYSDIDLGHHRLR